ncbi:O-antigen ligase [Candidatus Chloroploca sp. Khr17]|uniref:O-antigen ligase family protein n=1 Tax=Candidatus Chloroploca sp. Khr17 TaxID=2496869 RepID=UPI00101C19CB|nr:O-antigen ligase family protein [Candidatus Chloroploca sp. Khr17]
MTHPWFKVVVWLLVGSSALALALLPLTTAALLLFALVAVALAVVNPVWIIYLAILSVPVQELLVLPGGLSLTQTALVLMIGSFALHTLIRPDDPQRFGRLLPPLALFVWTLALSAVGTPYNRSEAVREVVRWATVPLIYLFALRILDPVLLREDRGWAGVNWRIWGLVAALLIAPAVTALVGLVQYWYGLGPPSFAIGGGRVRAYGTIGQPNSFAGYLNQAWPLAVGIALFAMVGLIRGARRLPAVVALAGSGLAGGLLLAGLVASFSRGGWIGAVGGTLALGVATVIMLPAQLRRLVRRLALVAAAGLIGLALLGGGGLLPATFTQRIASLTNNLRLFDARGVAITPANFAVVERMAHLQAAWHMLERYPLTGVGPGNYSIAYEEPPRLGERPISIRPWYQSRGHAHNYYLHIAAEAGIIGLTAYLILIGTVIVQAVRAVQAAEGWFWQGIAAGSVGVVGAVAAHNLFEHLHVLNMGLQLGTIWALLVLVEWHGLGTSQPAPDRVPAGGNWLYER